MSAVIEYQWVKFFKDENDVEHFIPQFRDDGTQQFWTDTEYIKPYKLLITTISPNLAAAMHAKKIPGSSVPFLPTYTFLLKPSDDIKAYWDEEVTITSHYECDSCGAAWIHSNSTKWAECPKCGEKDTWSCSRCGKTNIDNSIVKKNKRNETNCPYCEIPWGLNRKVYLQRVQDVIENTDYVILVKDRFKITIQHENVLIESL